MATNDDLDDFFKKKDRKGHKNKKQSGLLTNNQELLKQLEIVTSATSAFKENLYLDEDDEELQKNDEPVLVASVTEEIRKNPIKSNKNKIPDNTKTLREQEIINSEDGQQQDEWEDFESSALKYEQLRLKFAVGNNHDDDEYDYDENNHNDNDHNNDTTSDRNQQKDKPAWSTDQKKQEKETSVPIIAEKTVEDRPAPVKPTATGAYRPPALRGNSSSVTVVSGNPQRMAKKKEPNLASTDEFPTLESAVHKK
ncbi:unnamed protein product [Rotaria magnacalcarata]|uniref:CDV3 homolog n=1 Tax=Rotaria magnacalcarata TaxID=392030 RepID=A0A815XX93_9BILA|nr:unnamed protein product [Rotaria magnacalcarata]CAF1618466.1 unnamed protein product [Rotaria magnacalcarata]CAF2060612.1 unnamed protein product [Rotaria magnacalcarata]CAF2129122.1 unnamed protein product [Rotaria magnacalcarata]CAF3795668.1 unnamed protein product [Rotaria magnacalcarata]